MINDNIIVSKKNIILPKENIWTIYTKTNCIYCVKVKKLLDDCNINYLIVNCDNYLNTQNLKEQFLTEMENIIGFKYKTFPMVFEGLEFIGGYDNTLKYINNKLLNVSNDLIIKDDF